MLDELNGVVGFGFVLFICCPGWIADTLTSVEELLLLLVIVCKSWSIDLKLEKYAAWLIFVCSELGPLPMVIAGVSFPVVSGESLRAPRRRQFIGSTLTYGVVMVLDSGAELRLRPSNIIGQLLPA
jgi:hypothetical protein